MLSDEISTIRHEIERQVYLSPDYIFMIKGKHAFHLIELLMNIEQQALDMERMLIPSQCKMLADNNDPKVINLDKYKAVRRAKGEAV